MKLKCTRILFFSTFLPTAVIAANAIGNQVKAGGVHYNIASTEGLSACENNVNITPESSPRAGTSSRRQQDVLPRGLSGPGHRLRAGTDRSLGSARGRTRNSGAVGVRMML